MRHADLFWPVMTEERIQALEVTYCKVHESAFYPVDHYRLYCGYHCKTDCSAETFLRTADYIINFFNVLLDHIIYFLNCKRDMQGKKR